MQPLYLFRVENILQGSKFNVTSHTKVQQERSRQQGTAHGMHFVDDDVINRDPAICLDHTL